MPGGASGLFVEPALKVTFPDGNRDLVLHYVSHTTAANGFDVVLKDIKRPIFVTLHYAMDPDTGILARSATIENQGSSRGHHRAGCCRCLGPSARHTTRSTTSPAAGQASGR